jgi:hypothetical protein
MWNLPESTINVLLSGLVGLIGGLFSVPMNAFILWHFRRKELDQQHKLDVIAKERELLLQHRLEMKRKGYSEISVLRNEIAKIKSALEHLERVIVNE